MSYPVRPFSAPLWRMVHPARHQASHSGEGARLFGGRWNLKGWPALYFSADHATAVAEYYQGIAKPGTLLPFRVDAKAVVDLTDGQGGPVDDWVRDGLSGDWKMIARIDGQVPPSWVLAQELIAAGAEGALVPSAQNKGGTNLVLWRWHDAREAGEGAALSLIDPDASLTGKRRR